MYLFLSIIFLFSCKLERYEVPRHECAVETYTNIDGVQFYTCYDNYEEPY